MVLPDPTRLINAQQKLAEEEERQLKLIQKMMVERLQPDEPPKELPPLKKWPKPKGLHILVIGDSHAEPKVPNHRYEWLGRMVRDRRPDVVVDIGDWFDMPSLNRFDRPGSHRMEGQRYYLDIWAGVDAQRRFQIACGDYQPRLVRCLGNHESRISRAVENDPQRQAVFGLHHLESERYGWEEHPFLEAVNIGGVAFSHYFTSGVMGRPIGGENPAAMLLKKQFHSAVQGHSHVLDYCDRKDSFSKKIIAMHAGCYFHHEMDWAGPANQIYSRGILELHNVHNGEFDHQWTSIEKIREMYG